jgi:hypothetical protein
MAAEWLTLLGILVIVAVGGRFAFSPRRPSLSTLEWTAPAPQVRRHPALLPHRPIEQLVRDLRRLGPKLHQPPPGTSRVKVEAARYAYDRVLGEAAAAVGVEHLLAVIPPGEELDAERTRVENRLWLAGVRFEETA